LKKKPISSGLVPWVQNPLKIQEEKSKKKFFGYLSRYSIPFLWAKKFFKIFWLQLVLSTSIEKKIKNTQVVPGTKYGGCNES
jgi:hypothetical protein